MSHERLLGYGYVLLQFVCMAWLLAGTPLLRWPVAAAVVEAGGIGLGLWAIFAAGLGRFNITPTPRADALVTRGPYRWIRHPMYTAFLLAALGLVLNAFSWPRLAVWGVLLGTLVMKLHLEERLLLRRFADYAAYRARTARLVPGVY